jgi:primase-polymerase (primpol)-like protein
MVQAKWLGSVHGIVLFPLLGGAIATRGEQAMQDTEKDGAFDRELEAASAQQRGQNFVDGASFPKPLADQSRADLGAAGGNAIALQMRAEHGELFGESSQGEQEGIELAAGNQLIQAAEAVQDALPDLAADPMILHDEEIDARTVVLSANEQSDSPVPLVWPQKIAHYKNKLILSSVK